MLTPGDEEALLKDIKEGVLHALYLGEENGRFTEDEIHLDDIRMNKLQYIVNEDRDLGLTFGWFKYGPAPEDVTTESRDGYTALSQDEIPQLEESRLPSKDYLTTEAFAYYFLRELDDEFDDIVTAEETKVYLEDFYEQYAPNDEYANIFKDVYISSVRLQRTLDTIGDGREWHEDSMAFYYELEDRFTPLIEELANQKSLAHTVKPVEEYRRLLTSIIAEADDKNNISSSQQEFIKNVIRTFYNTIWDYVGQEMSLETMRGDNVDELRPDVKATAERYRNGSWRKAIDSLESRRSALNLDEDLDDVDELGPAGNEEDNQSLNRDLLENVSKVGAEVIHE